MLIYSKENTASHSKGSINLKRENTDKYIFIYLYFECFYKIGHCDCLVEINLPTSFNLYLYPWPLTFSSVSFFLLFTGQPLSLNLLSPLPSMFFANYPVHYHLSCCLLMDSGIKKLTVSQSSVQNAISWNMGSYTCAIFHALRTSQVWL